MWNCPCLNQKEESKRNISDCIENDRWNESATNEMKFETFERGDIVDRMGVFDVVVVEFFLTELQVGAVEPVARVGRLAVPRLARQGVVDVAAVVIVVVVFVVVERQFFAHQRRARRPVRFPLRHQLQRESMPIINSPINRHQRHLSSSPRTTGPTHQLHRREREAGID